VLFNHLTFEAATTRHMTQGPLQCHQVPCCFELYSHVFKHATTLLVTSLVDSYHWLSTDQSCWDFCKAFSRASAAAASCSLLLARSSADGLEAAGPRPAAADDDEDAVDPFLPLLPPTCLLLHSSSSSAQAQPAQGQQNIHNTQQSDTISPMASRPVSKHTPRSFNASCSAKPRTLQCKIENMGDPSVLHQQAPMSAKLTHSLHVCGTVK